MSAPVWFVTGTDTGVGKTVATAAIAATLRARGETPYVVKPAQTGVGADDPGDLDDVRRLVGPVAGHEGVRLAAPLAPDSAARLEGVVLPGPEVHAETILEAATKHTVIVEGAGGVLVPLGDGWDLLDLAVEVQERGAAVRVVVVARAGLGTLNHSALTVAEVGRRGLHTAGVLVGSWPEDPDLAERENQGDLPRLTGVPVLGRIPAGAGTLDHEEFTAAAPSWVRLPT